jgi:MFS-type transporter involved in bile tolerance (Atg22 family)
LQTSTGSRMKGALTQPARLAKWMIFFLLGYSLFADSANSIQVNLGQSLKAIYGITDKDIGGYFFCILFGAILGALSLRVISKFAQHDTLLTLASCALATSALLVGYGTNSMALYFACCLAGLSVGCFEASAKALFASEIDPSNAGYFMSMFASVQKFSGVMGPLIWASILVFGGDTTKELRYVFVIIAVIIFSSVPALVWSKKHRNKQSGLGT